MTHAGGGRHTTRPEGPTYFQAVNRNKRSVPLDLHAPADRERAQQLVAGADVLVENFRPGLMDELGLGYEDMAAVNPGLVYCSITGFGSAPAAAMLPGYDMLVQALGGLMSITGSRDGEPLKVGVALVDVICGLFAACGILRRCAIATAPAPAPASASRSICSRRCSRRSSTRAPRSRSRAPSPGGSATSIRASRPMNCSLQRTARS